MTDAEHAAVLRGLLAEMKGVLPSRNNAETAAIERAIELLEREAKSAAER